MLLFFLSLLLLFFFFFFSNVHAIHLKNSTLMRGSPANRAGDAAGASGVALASQRCAVYVHELHQTLPADKVPPDWPVHQHSMEWHLADAARRSPWRVDSPAAADLIVAPGNLTLLCVAKMTWSRRKAWKQLLDDRDFWTAVERSRERGKGSAALVLLSLQSIACGEPWSNEAPRPRGTLLLQETSRAATRDEAIISPFVINRPAWLSSPTAATQGVEGRGLPGVPAHMPWAARKLLFFAGHVPKLFQSPVRYLLWKQLHSDARVTCHSWTIGCTIGAYVACHQSNAEMLRQGEARVALARRRSAADGTNHLEQMIARLNPTLAHLATHCHGVCGNTSSCDASIASTVYYPTGAALAAHTTSVLEKFRRRCMPYLRLVNFTKELSGMTSDTNPEAKQRRAVMSASVFTTAQTQWRAGVVATTRDTSFADEAYLRHAMSHRFCLVAPGDWWSTKKIAEMIAVGGVGGCIPVFIAPTPPKRPRGDSKLRGQAMPARAGVGVELARFLPYAATLDYCDLAYFVPEATARRDMRVAIERLAAVTEAEAAAKHAALRRAHAAFVTLSDGSSVSAPEYLLGAACDAARRRKVAYLANASSSQQPLAGGDHQRCMLTRPQVSRRQSARGARSRKSQRGRT